MIIMIYCYRNDKNTLSSYVLLEVVFVSLMQTSERKDHLA